MNEAKRKRSESEAKAKRKRSESEANIYFRGMSELNARMEASVVCLKCVYSTIVEFQSSLKLIADS
jgi:hypothetical protein